MVVTAELQVQAYHPRTQRQPAGSLLTIRGLAASAITKAKTTKAHWKVHGTAVQSNSWIADAGVSTQIGGLVRVSELPGQLHAFFVLTAYIAVLNGAALWIIRRRDIAGAKGE